MRREDADRIAERIREAYDRDPRIKAIMDELLKRHGEKEAARLIVAEMTKPGSPLFKA